MTSAPTPTEFRKGKHTMSVLMRLWVMLIGLAVLAGCGINPVTGKQEIQLISAGQEIAIGEQNYLPSRQAQGGDYVVDPALVSYVQQVGNRLAQASDRPLPYEFSIINSSVPNAWALPGGKIAINRGLLWELGSEAELAAVLGHEIVHAAARHGAKAQERGMLMQGGLIATQVATADAQSAQLLAGGAMMGAQLIMTKYGRDAERESDYYGMQYMNRAGYAPAAAVSLQETFLRLSEGRQPNWLDGLFASHPPSAERVAANRETALALGDAGELGAERYQAALGQLVRDRPAYEQHDKALAAARAGDFGKAGDLVDEAIRLQPAEAKFHGLKGDLALNRNDYRSALTHYGAAIDRYPEYFAFHLHSGLAYQGLGRTEAARTAFTRSLSLLPTAQAHYELGRMALAESDEQTALSHFRTAAQDRSEVGRAAAAEMVRLEIAQTPEKYVRVQVRTDTAGRVLLVVGNQAPVDLADVQIMAAYFDAQGRQVTQTQRFRVEQTVAPGQAVAVSTGWTNPQGIRTGVVAAAIAE
jgi:predicted Zn-dependent protease